MADYLHKELSMVCQAYRVNCWKELVETWHADEVTIIGVPFCGLEGIGTKTTKIRHKKSNLCQNYAIEFLNEKQLAKTQPLREVN